MSTAPPTPTPPPDAIAGHVSATRVIAVGAVIVVGLAALIVLGVLPRIKNKQELRAAAQVVRSAAPAVNVVHARPAGATGTLLLPGYIQGWHEATIYARTNGYVVDWMHDIGDRVKYNEILAVITTPELDQQVEEARAALNQAQADLGVAQANFKFAEVSLVRWKEAVGDGAVSRQELDEKQAGFSATGAQVVAAEAAINTAAANLRRLEVLKSFEKVVAPFDGVISARLIDIGSLITAGSSLQTTPMFKIVQADTVRVFADVPQRAIEGLKVGDSADVLLNELPDRVFTGKIARRAGALNTATRTQQTEVDVPNPDGALLPGMYCTVRFTLNNPQDSWLVPSDAVVFNQRGLQVIAVDSEGIARFRPIQIARDLGTEVVAVSGVNGREPLVVNAGDEVRDGQKVRIVAARSQPATQPAAN